VAVASNMASVHPFPVASTNSVGRDADFSSVCTFLSTVEVPFAIVDARAHAALVS
jgi:hypothetical protein